MIPRTSFASHLSSSSHFGRNFCRSGNNLEERTTKEEREGKRDWKKKRRTVEEQTVGGWKETRREEWRGTKRDESEWEAGGGGMV